MKRAIFTVWLLLAVIGPVLTQLCVKDVSEDTHIGSSIGDFNCTGGRTPNITNSNPYFSLKGAKLILAKSVRLDTNHSKVGHGQCYGSGNINDSQIVNLECAGPSPSSKTCYITITPVDNFAPAFCNGSCYQTEHITIHLNESHPLGNSDLIYTGRICDNDTCSKNCHDPNLMANDTSLIGSNVNTAEGKGSFHLWLNTELDFETSRVHYVELTLKAYGHANVTTILTIYVDDIDDQGPAFTQRLYQCDILEGNYSKTDKTNCTVVGFDQDSGVNATLRYEILSSFPDNTIFGIDNNGALTLNGTLDRETVDEYVLEILVYEYGRKSDRYNYTTVIVRVDDVDDNPPQFTNGPAASIDIVENLNDGAIVFIPTVTDRDEGANANFKFTMDGHGMFGINETTGVISVKNSSLLDRETHNGSMKFTIFVNSTQTPSNGDSMTLTVSLKDVNDNSPVFTNNSVYVVDIAKDFSIGRDLLLVRATDRDSGQNGDVTYSLESSTSMFSLDQHTGNITLSQSLQNTTVQLYQLDVKAVDNPVDATIMRSSWASVTINVTDVNLHAPDFTVLHHLRNITENVDIGTVMADVKCTDMDWADVLKVSIKSGDLSYFNLSKLDGTIYRITLIQEVDREVTDELNLKIEYTDGANTETRDLRFGVLDQNDNSPVFSESVFNITKSISESSQIGTVVLNITANDSDKESPNNEVRYLIQSGNLNNTFSLNETTGILTLNSVINASVYDYFDLAFVAHDDGVPMNSNVTNINIRVIDVNNNPPFFLFGPYEATVRENFNGVFLKVHATDPDKNSTLNFEVDKCDVTPTNLTFKDNELQANYIDAEATTNQTIICNIIVSDGNNSVSSNVTIQVLDENDNFPLFDSHNLNVNISDTLPVGSLVMEVSARDKDISTLGEDVSYFLEEHAVYSSYFAVDYKTGKIILQRSLEDLITTEQRQINMTVIAQDAGSPPLRNNINISIQVIQDNAHSPSFDKSPISFSFKENNSSFSAKIHAIDDDGDTVSYTIAAGNVDDIFTLDNKTGILTTANVSYTFDYEVRSIYSLIIEATDNATFPRSSTVTVIVAIEDVNEPPTILNLPLEGVVHENTNSRILQVYVADPDQNSILTFKVGKCDVTPNNLTFKDNELQANFIDAEATRNQTIICNIIVSDGNNSVSSNVNIQVLDENDNFPVFDSHKLNVNISDTLPVGSLVMEVSARDKDISTLGEDVSYFLEENAVYSSYFAMNDKTGKIILQRSLEDLITTEQRQINMTVIAQDAGSPPLRNNINISIQVIQDNAHSPSFDKSPISFSFKENNSSFSAKIHAIDDDGDTVSYTIAAGNVDDIFTLDNKTGILTTANVSYTFDYEVRSIYSLIIEATDNATFPRSSTVTVIVAIEDVNEPPTILNLPLEGVVHENTNSRILQVYVADPDQNSILTFKVGKCDVTPNNLTFKDNELQANFIDAEATRNQTIICNIIVSDGNNYVSSNVNIQVLDENDNFPVFDSHKLNVNISDTLPVGSLVMEVSARDKDISTLGEDVSYFLEENAVYSSYFAMNDKRGKIILQRSLEDLITTEQRQINMTVIAQDAGSPPLRNNINVSIQVIQDNAHSPSFDKSPISFSFKENNSSFSAKIHAVDDDGDTVSYTIAAGNADDIFTLDDKTGILTTANVSYTFDYEVRSIYSLIIEATDNATFPRSSTVTVIVAIEDVNEPPTILNLPLEGVVHENTNSRILQVYVADPDQNSIPTFKVGKCDVTPNNLTFKENELQANFIDAEATRNQTIICNIIVSDGNNSVSSNVTIQVLDENDNFPVFDSHKLNVNISDTLPVGSLVMEVSARDKDISTLGEDVSYFLEEHAVYSSYLAMNYKTGKIILQRSLEDLITTEQRQINMTVIAQDAGSPPLRNNINISIQVIQDNAHSPSFDKSPMSFSFKENNSSFSAKIHAIDDDGDTVSYTIAAGNADDIFTLDNKTGILTTANVSYTFDYEVRSIYSLIIEATDNATFPRSSTVTVIVAIEDVNEPPTILNLPLEGVVHENTNSRILQVYVADPDQNSILTFKFGKCDVTPNNLTFKDNELQANFIDAEATTNQTIICNIIVSDGNNSVSSNVTIQVLDENDNFPLFDSHKLNVNISDTLPVGSLVMEVSARDKDISTLGEDVSYFLEENAVYSSYFAMNDKTGKIILQRSLEDLITTEQRQINMTVIAQDAGSPPLRNNINVSIQVIQDNAHSPSFDKSPISFSFKENNSFFSAKVHAIDDDGDTVSYTIAAGNADDIFTLDNKTGILTTANVSYTFDYEVRSIYSLIIEATDNATFPRSSTVTVIVAIEDVNEPPTILNLPLEGVVHENTNSRILQVYVVDLDQNSILTFKVGKCDVTPNNLTFKDNELQANFIDAEATTNQTIICNIIVSDGNNSVSSNVTIQVLDENDNFPVFDSRKLNFNISDTLPVGSLVMEVSARDKDISTLGEDVSYFLEENAVYSSYFAMNDKTGKIILQRSLEDLITTEQRQINMTVIAQDAGSPPLRNNINVSIQVIQDNAHSPSFDKSPISFSFKENNSSFSAKIHAIDDDGDTVSYTIAAGNADDIFTLDNKTGILTTANVSYTFDYEVRSIYSLIIEATDNATFPRSSTVTVIVAIEDVNEPPTILNLPLEGVVHENTNSRILQVYVVDLDQNSILTFKVGKCDVTPNNLTFKDNELQANFIDAEATTNQTIICNIIVSDGNNSVSSNVTIQVLDENDNFPVFDSRKLNVNISDTLPVGSLVMEVSARDKDISTLGEDVSYFLEENAVYSSYFAMNDKTGKIILQRSLEDLITTEQRQINMTVIAQDAGSPPLRNNINVSIQVIQDNAHSPSFDKSPISFSFKENNSSFSAKIHAIDDDGDTVSYTIAAGNADDIFTLDNKTGILTTANVSYTFDYEVRSIYSLIIEATDNATFPRSSTVTIIVAIEDVNEPPTILNLPLEGVVHENTNSRILQVYVADPDQNSILTFKVGKCDVTPNNLTFKDNELQASFIDAEATRNQTIICNIIVSDGYNSVSSNVTIQVLDENDNFPVFDSRKLNVNISDTLPVGSLVMEVSARDKDISTLGEDVSYFLEENAVYSSYFVMNDKTGKIILQRSLEDLITTEQRQINMTVIAQDAGSPPLRNNINVSIQVIQDNAHSPSFDKSPILLSFKENNSSFSAKINAIDHDGDTVSYTIVAGNADDIFTLDNTTGILTTANVNYTFNYEVRSRYRLIIEATDNATFPRSSTVTVIVAIEDVNEPPTILNLPLEGVVHENTNSRILQVYVADPDQNNILTFKVGKCDVTPNNLTFKDNELQANFIDAEATKNQTIICNIIVSDGNNSVSSNVTIQVLDENDNFPVFDSHKLNVNISDTLPVGSLVMEVSARDKDISTLGEDVSYFLEEHAVYSSYFAMDYKTGKVILQRSLEDLITTEQRQINMTVIAQDAGSPPLRNNINVSIQVIQDNAHSPSFDKSPISFSFKENNSSFSAKIQAIDDDGDTVSYTIAAGNADDIFTLDNKTGILTTANVSYTFDYEVRSIYSLIIEATDNATFPRSSTVTVIVAIEDVNEPPIISTSAVSIYRKINTTAGNKITDVKVYDPDTNITFCKHDFDFGSADCKNVTSNNMFFFIDQHGEIKVNQILSQNGSFELTVMVTNLNFRVCSNLTVIVSNVEGSSIAYNITENNELPHKLGTLQDGFNYTISSPISENITIYNNESSSNLITWTKFDYEKMPDHQDHTLHFLIDGVNKLTQTLGQQIQVTVNVINVNDNPPVFNSSHYRISMYENVALGDTVGLVTATDADGTLTPLSYTANVTDLFQIDSASGTIQLVQDWDFDNTTDYVHVLNVTCNDTNYTSYSLVTITLLDMNDNPPTFSMDTYEFYINETASVGAIVRDMWITGMDVDTMDAGKLTYHIISGGDGNYFSLDPNSGNFTLTQDLDYEQTQLLKFKVVVFDTALHNDTATIKVHIIDNNDNPPRFNKTSYTFTVQEGLVYNDDSFMIDAYDMDSGQNGLFTLMLQNPHGPEFSLSQQDGNDTGYLHIVSPFDRESPEVPHVNGTAIFTVNVIATDHGTPPQSSSVLVHIRVEDVNDCPPEFSQSEYSVDVQEGVDIGQQVISFTTTDCDYNPAFKQTNFTLSGHGCESFQISPMGSNVAVVTVAKELDRNTQTVYDLEITVTDGANDVSRNLTITVLDTNDHTPNFTSPTYNFTVTEEQPANITVGMVSATDEDVGANGNVTYTITSGNQGGWFEIVTNYDVVTGEIKTRQKLDREAQAVYEMIITAEDSAVKGQRQGTCTVTISLADINDNTPIFNTNHGYQGTVTENSPNDTVVNIVPRIYAKDIDFGTNGTEGIRYSLLGDASTQSFHINETTGEITVVGNIDREITSVFNLRVIAKDGEGGANAKSTTTNLTIRVDDVNDCPPKFVNNTYSFSVRENSNSSTSIGKVSVTDDDVSGTEHVRFRIIHGDDEKFYIDTVNGVIRVSGNLDREMKAVYTLTVTANDGINEGNTTVTVDVVDVNDNAPVFNQQSMVVTVQENSKAPTKICNITATDNDQDATNNSLITYSLDRQSNFSISTFGELSAMTSLDRELQDQYVITVHANDNGVPEMNSSMKITVIVGDLNDNNPQFFDESGRNITEKTVNIVEKAPVNSVVSLIVARDKDSGENGTILFSIAPSNISEYFKIEQIDNVTAVAKVAKSVNINTLVYSGIVSKNFTESVTLDLSINAKDNGTMGTSLNTTMTLHVVVEALNDATPVFVHPREIFHISENADIGSSIGSCKAVVANTTLVHLTYALLDNSTKREFSINPENCTITTKTLLDREVLEMYNFPVMVTDGRTPERTAYTEIRIIVTDVNDNRPVFYRPVISFDVLENTNFSQPINVSAEDADVGNNSIITYNLLDTFGGIFDVNTDTGMLNVTQPLDYELHTHFSVIVVATDHGHVPLNATSTVYVTVLDANDNPPKFHNVNHTVHVEENHVGKIHTFFANDSDAGLNGKVVYRIESSLDGVFSIDQLDGTVNLLQPFDYEAMTSNTVHIQITATDEGTPPMSTSINVAVQVDDVEDFVPSFNQDIYERNISRSAKLWDLVIDLNATDAKVTYALQGSDSDYFMIEKGSGIIRVATTLDVQTSRYLLTAVAVDDNHRMHTATCTVIVTVVDHLLSFPHKEYHVNLAENVEDVSVLVDLNTTEEINGGQVLYTITRTEPTALDTFTIDTKGRISCLKSLDRENNTQYALYITAEPRYARRRRDIDNVEDSSTLVKIVVHVTDVNDNPPVFPNTQKRQFGVPRDARSGYLVTTLQALDKDEPIPGEAQIHYRLLDGATTMFDIQEESGAIVVHRAISSTTNTKFNLTVVAFDPADGAKNDTLFIEIHVIENSDRLLLVTSIPVEDFKKRQVDIARNMSSVLGVDVQVEKVEAHKETDNGVISVNLDSSDLYFHGINRTTGMPVPNSEMMALINSHSGLLESLLKHFNVTGISVTPVHDTTSMGVPEIALISVALVIFLGGLVAILIACSSLRSVEQTKDIKVQDLRISDLEDFELGTIRSHRSSKLSTSRDMAAAAAAINPAFIETEFNTSGTQSISDKPPTEQESQEIRLEFGDEPIDRNLPEAEVRGGMIHFPSQSAVDSGVGNTSLGSHDVLQSESPDTQSDQSDLITPNGLVPDTGPVMTSSPKIVRFREPAIRDGLNTPEEGNAEDGRLTVDDTAIIKPRMLRLASNVGETETDDGIETDDNDGDDYDIVIEKSGAATLDKYSEDDDVNTEVEEVTSF